MDYSTGRTYQLDTAARMAVRTSVSQLSGRITEENIKKTGVDLVITSQHIGSRPEHAPWQNKVFSYSGKSKKYPDFFKGTGYGTAGGLKGVNCTHDFYPFWEGSSVIPEDVECDEEYYKNTQKQRQMERNIRATKREIEAQKAIGGDVTELQAKLRKQLADYHKFSSDVGIRAKDNRLRVTGGTADLKRTKAWKDVHTNRDGQEVIRKLAIRKGNIYNINTVNAQNISEEVLKSIDKTMHNMFKEMPYLKNEISEIVFCDTGDDIALAAINRDLKMRLKLNNNIFADETILTNLLETTPSELSLKSGLDGYIRHEFTHFQEYYYAIRKNTHNGYIDKAKAYDEILQSIYAKELLDEALNTCKMEYTYDTILSISEYATYNASEAISEAVSYCENDNKLCEAIKKLVKKKWGE